MVTFQRAYVVLKVTDETDYIRDRLAFTFRDEGVDVSDILSCSFLHFGYNGVGLPVRLDYIAQAGSEDQVDYLYRHRYLSDLCKEIEHSLRKTLLKFIPLTTGKASDYRAELYKWLSPTEVIVLVEPRKYGHVVF
jgi:hypothetical protein